MDRDAKKLLIAESKYGYLGIFFGVAVFLGFFGGRWLDGRFHTEPWLSIIGLLVGIASGFTELYRLAKRSMRDEKGNDTK